MKKHPIAANNTNVGSENYPTGSTPVHPAVSPQQMWKIHLNNFATQFAKGKVWTSLHVTLAPLFRRETSSGSFG
jgi:hypothetical protein